MDFVTNAWTGLVRAVGSVLDVLFRYAGIIFSFFLGLRKAQQAEIQKDSEIKDRQLQDAARAPKSRKEIIERMKRYGL